MTSRRGFIKGLLGLVAAPAVIRVADLMPISSAHLWQDIPQEQGSGLIWGKDILREAARLWYNHYKELAHDCNAVKELQAGITQSSIEFSYTDMELTLTFEEFSRRFLEPAIPYLPPPSKAVGTLPLPEGVYEAVSDGPLRLITAYDINTNQTVTRIDLLHKK